MDSSNTSDLPGLGYLINQYPKVSHTFIRREIAALEASGTHVRRFAIRGWDADVPDPEDAAEQRRTTYLLQGGASRLALQAAAWMLAHPRRAWRGWLRMRALARDAARPWPWHLAYLAEACRLVSACEGGAIRHLHAHFGTNAAEVAALAHAMGGPSYSFTVHGPEEFDDARGLKLAEKAGTATFVIAVSSFGRSQLYRWLSAGDWPRVHVVHCGIDAAFTEGAGQPVPDVPRFVCVGRLCEQKGQLLLIDAVATLRSRGLACHLVLAGDGELRPQIEAAVLAAGLQDAVHITGWIGSQRVRSEILQSRALVLPSFAEGLPVVLMEALALGRPVISTYVAGIPELVRSGTEGWLVPAGDARALAGAMADALLMPAAQATRMGAAGRERVAARHAISNEAARLKTLFRSVLARPDEGALT